MRILFLLTQSLESPSGQGRFAPIARALAQQGHSVELAALHPDWGALGRRRFDWEGVRVTYAAPMHVRRAGNVKTYYGPRQLLAVTARATLALAQVALARDIDVIHLAKAQPMNGLAGWLAARWRRLPLYLDCDDYEAASNTFGAAWQRSLVRWWEDRLPRAVCGVTTNTTFMQQRCVRLGVRAERVRLVPNGFDPERFSPMPAAERAAARREWGLADEPVVVYVGSLSLSSHAVLLLLEAFALVRQRLPRARLWLVGGGEDFELVREAVRRRGLEPAVTMTGRVDYAKTRSIYGASDVSVDPVADEEAARARSPLKVVESLACGVPVVTGAVGDRATVLAEGQAGVLVHPGRADALAEGLLAVLEDPTRAAALGTQAVEASRRYRWSTLAAEFAAVYGL